jgi:uncharacterized repeat protein (TIGR03803 family)
MELVANLISKAKLQKRPLFLLALYVSAAIALSAQTFNTIHKFNVTDGSSPMGALVQGLDGNLYGTTFQGGPSGALNDGRWNGTLFKITLGQDGLGKITVIYNFCSLSNCADGNGPHGALTRAATGGEFYGVTTKGGANTDASGLSGGTIFKITPRGTLRTLYNFCAQLNCTDGEYPWSVTQAPNGELYGTTTEGGKYGGGTVFKISPSGALKTLYNFCSLDDDCASGKLPYSGLLLGAGGAFWGTTTQGGTHRNGGTIFKITQSGEYTTIYNFCVQSSSVQECSDGADPSGTLVQTLNGDIFGVTSAGGTGAGTIFKVTPSGTFKTFYNFCSQAGCMDGGVPEAGLIQASDGNLYGTTTDGGLNGYGTIFKITPSGTLTTLYSICSQKLCADGWNPMTQMVQSTNGYLYGTNLEGGETLASPITAETPGTIFMLSVGLSPFVQVQPGSGTEGEVVEVLGTDLTGATSVAFNGVAASFVVDSKSLIKATVPEGATSGMIEVVTPSGPLNSSVPFTVK